MEHIKKHLTKLLFTSLIVFGMLSGGCVFNADHNRRHWESFTNDVHEIHHFIDKYFLLYDRDDPENW